MFLWDLGVTTFPSDNLCVDICSSPKDESGLIWDQKNQKKPKQPKKPMFSGLLGSGLSLD